MTAFWLYMVFHRGTPAQEAAGYYIEVFQNHIVLNGDKTDPRKIPFLRIKSIKRFEREMTMFKDNDIDAVFEQEKRPFIHIATDNIFLYLLKYSWDDKAKESVVDIDDIVKFQALVFGENTTTECSKCGEEFKTDTKSRRFECPLCGVEGTL